MIKKFIQKIIHNLKRQYRLEFIDEETLSSSKHFSFRPILWVAGSATLFFGIIGGTSATIWYTPAIREQIPGYTNPDNARKLITMQSHIARLEEDVKSKDEYILTLKKVLNNGSSAEPTTQKEKGTQKELPEIKIDPYIKEAIAQNNPNKTTEAKPQISQPTPGEAASSPKSSKVELKLKTFLRPVIGDLRDGFSPSKGHYGIDIGTNANETVLAATEGYVQISDFTEADGYMIAITNPSGVTTIYKHNSMLLKKKGSYVHAGEPIAKVGNTGENSSGPHLHFEIWYNGEPLNPVDYVKYK